MKLLKVIFISFISLALVAVSSCKKTEGTGGNSSITGKVIFHKYANPTGTLLVYQGEYAGAYEDVYIIYGDDATYGARLKTNPDGIYEFKYLRPGKYKVYAYSSGVNVTTNRVAVIKEVEIAKKKQTVEAETLNIDK